MPCLVFPPRFEFLADTRLASLQDSPPTKEILFQRINEGGGVYLSWEQWFLIMETWRIFKLSGISSSLFFASHLWNKICSPQEYSAMKSTPWPEEEVFQNEESPTFLFETHHRAFELILRHWKSQKRGYEIISSWLMSVMPFPMSRWPDYFWCEECQSVDSHAREPGTCLWGLFSTILKIVWASSELFGVFEMQQQFKIVPDTETRCVHCWNIAVKILHMASFGELTRPAILTWCDWERFQSTVALKSTGENWRNENFNTLSFPPASISPWCWNFKREVFPLCIQNSLAMNCVQKYFQSSLLS